MSEVAPPRLFRGVVLQLAVVGSVWLGWTMWTGLRVTPVENRHPLAETKADPPPPERRVPVVFEPTAAVPTLSTPAVSTAATSNAAEQSRPEMESEQAEPASRTDANTRAKEPAKEPAEAPRVAVAAPPKAPDTTTAVGLDPPRPQPLPSSKPEASKQVATPMKAEPSTKAPAAAKRTTKPSTGTRPETVAFSTRERDGTPLRVYVPTDALGLANHLARTGGCLAVSRPVAGGGAVVVAFLGIDRAGRAVPGGAQCTGIPHELAAGLNVALGNPVARVRSTMPQDQQAGLFLHVFLDSSLESLADRRLAERFPGMDRKDGQKRAIAEGFSLKCYALSTGGFDCQGSQR